MKIKNINGTSDNVCKCGSWLAHWEKFSGTTANFCSEKICIGKDLVGAHVQLSGNHDNKWYIVPLCEKHNHAAGELEISDGTKLVSANRSETCEK
jgi:hypothetical protein